MSQIDKKIAYLGPKGTYSHEMAVQIYPLSHLIPYYSIEDVLDAVEMGEADEAVVPIENSTEGAVLVTLDVLAHEVNLKITGEYLLPIRHYLWGRPDDQEVKRIISHPQALGQCRKFIRSHYPDAEIFPVSSSAGAVQEILKSGLGTAAIGGIQAGQGLDLTALHSDIQDHSNNCTRFVRVAKSEKSNLVGKSLKSSFVCKINGEKAGSLQELLQQFSCRNINMTRIESRPTGQKMGEYYFFIDIVAMTDSGDWEEALKVIEENSLWYKNLGIYPLREEA